MMRERFLEITGRYAALRIALAGDFCLDRYLEIDPSKRETSLETGLPVHNVVRVRSQPGGAGTILGNLEALGVAEIHAVGFYGEDGEGFELLRALEGARGARLDHFIRTPARRTFTYCKPLFESRRTGRPSSSTASTRRTGRPRRRSWRRGSAPPSSRWPAGSMRSSFWSRSRRPRPAS